MKGTSREEADSTGSLSKSRRAGEIDGLSTGLDCVVIAFADLVEDVAHLVHPAALMGHTGIHGLNSGRQSRTSIGDDQQKLVCFQSAAIEVVEQGFPVRLALALGT